MFFQLQAISLERELRTLSAVRLSARPTLAAAAILAVLAVGGPIQAQVSSAELMGAVRDAAHAAVPGTIITATHDGTGFMRTTETDGAGAYRLNDLLPGCYTVSAAKEGFAAAVASGVVLEVNQTLGLDLRLSVAPQRDSATVTSVISPLQTTDASAGYRLGASSIRGLPLEIRNVSRLITLGPGSIPRHLGGFTHDVVNDFQEARGAVALNPPINGARSTTNSYLLDGALNTDLNTRVMALKPPFEAVLEFRTQAALAPAEFYQSAGGVSDVVTKTGSQEFHGSAFEFLRHEAADARNYFDDPTQPRPLFRQNQFGGSIGGPLPVPSSFFFAAYEGLRGRTATSLLRIVPDAALRSGDFNSAAPIFDPLTSGSGGGPRDAFANRIIPQHRISPIASRFLEEFQPLPNTSAPGGNYVDSTPTERVDDNASVRLDHELRQGRRLFLRYGLNSERNRLAGAFPELPSRERVNAQQAAFGFSSAGPNWVNEARFSFTRLKISELPENAFVRDVARELGVGGVAEEPVNYGLPFFLVTNFSLVSDTPNRPQDQRDNIWYAADTFSKVIGSHTLKVGGQFTRFEFNYLQSSLSRGRFTFTGAFSAQPAAVESGGDPFADFLLGAPEVTERNVGLAQAHMRQHTLSGFIQDEWQAHPRFTLNLGLRYEYASPFRDRDGQMLNLDYSRLPEAPTLAPTNAGSDPDRNNWAPRVALAWRVPGFGDSTVFRAGYGVYYNPEIAIESYDLIRNRIRNEINFSDGSAAPVLSLANGFPATSGTGFPSYFGLDRNARTPYLQQWTASLQHEFPRGLVADLAYIGSKGSKLGRFRQFNTPLRVVTGENLAPRPGDLQSLRPFPDLGPIIQRQHIANSSYQSLQLRLQKRLGTSFGLLASFVWAKSIDDADSILKGLFDSAGAQDERNLRLERGLSFFDVRKRLSAGFVYRIPAAPILRPLLSDWQVSGILTLQDGTPLNPFYFAFDPANTGTKNRPNVVPGQRITLPRNERTVERFFNPDAFADPEPFTFGNAGRNIIPGPGNSLFDFAVSRRFPLAETAAMELRTEFFNLFNHPNLGIPGPYPDFGPFFGRIFSVGDPRRLQFSARIDF
jgi:hypothetical protein